MTYIRIVVLAACWFNVIAAIGSHNTFAAFGWLMGFMGYLFYWLELRRNA